MIVDRWIAICLVPLTLWILVSGLDDLILDLVCFFGWIRSRVLRRGALAWPAESEMARVPQKRIAIFVPLWREHRVIEKMLEHNLAVNQYPNCDFFVGAYPNDGPTLSAVREAHKRFAKVHLAVCPHDGPTSKADCLNWIFQRMLLYEEDHETRFDIVMTHDAEDLIHPESLQWVNYFSQKYDMVQVPVLPLPTPLSHWTHGVYCDEFAEYQTKDLPARHMMGGFVPSNGVGTGFSRAALEALAAANSNRIFEPGCLTEDYENGFRIYRMKLPQIFIPLRKSNGNYVATREFFPFTFRAAVRQRSRWIMGIALQSWERHGWKESATQVYWFWRDRKVLVGHLVGPLSNLIFLYGAATWFWSIRTGQPWGLARATQQAGLFWTYLGTLSLQFFHMLVRAWCSGRIYGWRFAAGAPLRNVWGNWINFFADVCALRRYFSAKLHGRPLVWVKTEHAYPSRAALTEHKRRLGEILVRSEYIAPADLELALASKPSGVRVGEFLVRAGKLNEDDLYEALSLQQNLPLAKPGPATISVPITRSLPAECSRKWKVLPFKVSGGHLYVVGPELPTDEMNRDLQRFTAFDIRFHLITPSDFEQLAEQYLPK